MTFVPLAVAATIVATRLVLLVSTIAAISAIVTQTGKARQGWREARRQRKLLQNPQLPHNKEFDNAS